MCEDSKAEIHGEEWQADDNKDNGKRPQTISKIRRTAWRQVPQYSVVQIFRQDFVKFEPQNTGIREEYNHKRFHTASNRLPIKFYAPHWNINILYAKL